MIPRLPARFLGISAAALIGLYAAREDIKLDAYIPVPGDVWTIAAGTTQYPDGRPVQKGDHVTPQRALILLGHDAARHTQDLMRCIGDVPLYQRELDAYAAMAHNVGAAAVCRSSIPVKLRAGRYADACATIKDFVCGPASEATRAKPGAKCYSAKKMLHVMRGLANAREREYKWCMGETTAWTGSLQSIGWPAGYAWGLASGWA